MLHGENLPHSALASPSTKKANEGVGSGEATNCKWLHDRTSGRARRWRKNLNRPANWLAHIDSGPERADRTVAIALAIGVKGAYFVSCRCSR